MIDLQSEIPIYIQIRDDIKGKILSGKLACGDKIASEQKLMEEYNVSRVTLRNAIAALSKEGLLIKKQGKGTFVNTRKIQNKLELLNSFTETCKGAGLCSKSKTLLSKIESPSPTQKSILNLEDREKILHIRRLRFAGEDPIMYEDDYFPYYKYAFLEKEDLSGSLFEVLRKYHIIPLSNISGDDMIPLSTLEVLQTNQEQSELLQCNIGTPIFYIKTVIYDTDKQPIHIGIQYMLGDRFKFVMR